MKGTLALFDVAGYVALLLWGTQMVTRVYLRILRDLQRVHSHLAAIAYPRLERAGLLRERLIDAGADAAPVR